MGYTKINSNDQLDLIGSCVSNCNGTDLTFNFTLFYTVQNASSGASQWVKFYQNDYTYSAGLQNEQLLVEKQIFSDYSYVLWKVQMTGSLTNFNKEIYESFSSIIFYVNHSPRNGTCDVYPKNGTTNDLFTLSCFNWNDTDGFVTKYVYYGKFNKIFTFYFDKHLFIQLKLNSIKIN